MNHLWYCEFPRYLWFLLLIIPVWGLYIKRWKLHGAMIQRLATPEHAARVGRIAVTRLLCFSGAWFFIVLALSNPFAGTHMHPVKHHGCAVSLVIDISRSMLTPDVDVNRLYYASDFASQLINGLGESHFSIVLVKGGAHLAVPATRDRMCLFSLLSSLSPSLSSEPGTNIAAGIDCAVSSFPQDSSESCFIVVLTDGESLSGDIAAAASRVKQAGITAVFAGIGTTDGGLVPDSDGVVSHLDERALIHAAERCGGQYVPACKPGSGAAVLSLIQKAAAGPHVVFKEQPRSWRTLALIGAATLFCAGVLCSPGVMTIRRKTRADGSSHE